MSKISASTYSLGLRVWHVLNGLVVIGLLGTYFLRDTLLSVRGNRQMFVDKLAENDIQADINVGKDLARALVDKLWVWHVNLGYVLAALLVMRLVIFLSDRVNPFSQMMKAVRAGDRHAAAVKGLYTVFYGVEAFMVLSGLSMVFSDQVGLPKGVTDAMGEAHETLMWFFVFFIVAHVVGVVRSELTDDPGLVSRMIHGGRK